MNSEKISIFGVGLRYTAHVGRGLLAETGRLTRELVRGDRAAVISDSKIPRRLVKTVSDSLASAEFQVTTVVVPAGEKSKTLHEVERIGGAISTLDRTSVIVGVGGGVVGDLSGFVAAIFHRGIAHVQVPTTLLAMVDSSIGGKTAVNLAAGKNLLGAFHPPLLVIADVAALETLPARELRQGYAEIVKHAIIRDAKLFRQLQGTKRGDWIQLIRRNIEIKATIVAADERDVSGERGLLNFGHTIGHAIEAASEFQIRHGDCVSLGIIAACHISVKHAGLSPDQRDEVISLLHQFELPTRLPTDISRERIVNMLRRDKKFHRGEIRFVVTPHIGQAMMSREVTMSDIQEAIALL